MEKVFNFIKSLTPSFYEVVGYPTIKVYCDLVEVYFDCTHTILDLSLLVLSGPDSFRMYANNDVITIVYVFELSDL